LAEARFALRSRRRRSFLTGVGIGLAAAMLAAAVVVSDGLGGGFDRAARAADLPDVIVRFDPQQAGRVAQRIRALPDLQAFSLREEFTGVDVSANGHSSAGASAELIGSGRRGYALVAGHDLSGQPGQVVLERGLASAWGVHLGEELYVGGLGPQRVVGFAQAPDNVSYPLAAPRVYLSQAGLARRPGSKLDPRVNYAQIWLRDPRKVDEVLVQARATSYGLSGVRFVTRTGLRVLLDQAAGIVIDLLVALSVIALATAGAMLAASARAEVQRRLQAIGIRRAVGASRAHLTLTQALETLLVAMPAATIGAVAGTFATYRPASRLLTLLNEPAPGTGLLLPLGAAWLASIAIPVIAAAWPAWRAAGRNAVSLLQGADLDRRARPRRRLTPVSAGLSLLGARLVGARRTRMCATAVTLGASTAFVLLMLALAASLASLETDPGALGKRYQLTAGLPASDAARLRAIRGVDAVAPRYETEAVDSFSLGEPIDVIAYRGDHTEFEAPPLTSGTRMHGRREAEVGVGLAGALGLSPGSMLAIQLSSGAELRLRVAGVVSSLDHDGRVAYVPAGALVAADPDAPEQLAIRVAPGASPSAISARLGTTAAPTGGATARGVPLVDTLRSILRAIAIVDGLVCVYALVEACAITVRERRRTVSVLRAFGAGSAAVRRLLAGAVAALVIPAAVIGILIERLVLGPAMSRLAAGYATLPLRASELEIAAVLAGLAAAGAVAILWVARQTTSETVIAGLRGT
jgi:predicted lysophospholipase L1 biosynthesis ABC-type transport system permease subunit